MDLFGSSKYLIIAADQYWHKTDALEFSFSVLKVGRELAKL